jgi:hypothetical protein
VISIPHDDWIDKIRIREDGCWNHLSKPTGAGYTFVQLGKRPHLAHRVLFRWLVGEIPEGLVIDHLCRNRWCINPSHMEPVTMQENILRGEGLAAANARKTECVNGHPFDEANTYWWGTAGRHRGCKACRRENQRRYLARKAALCP